MSAEPIPELQRLGQRLQQARQAQGISLHDQAERLHMGAEQLRALEQGNREELPEAVFVVAQARRVAASLGLDIDADIAALRGNQAFQSRGGQRKPQARPVTVAAQPQRPAGRADPATPRPAGATPRQPRPLLALGAGLAAVAALAWGLQHHLGGTRTAPPTAATAPESSARPTGASEAPAPVRGSTQASKELVLRSAEPSWLEVRAAGGELLFRGMLEGQRRFPLGDGLQVLAGRPDLVTATTGQAPAQPLGPIEAVTWYRFSAPAAPAPAP